MKRMMALFFALAFVLVLAGCQVESGIPYNGDITFHDLSLTIPDDYIRDSTQSNADLWCFEKGNYKQIIILSRKDASEDVSAAIASYAEYMAEQGCESSLTTFREMEAVHSTYTQNEQYCQEMLFALNGSFYAIALRGGTEAEFQTLLETVTLPNEE